MTRRKPVVLAILDGWGIERPSSGNAIHLAQTPHMDAWHRRYPHATLISHGAQVGLLSATTGNSEVGHINIGAGYIVPQDEVRINLSIDDKSFFHNATLIEACQKARKPGVALHVLALMGPGEVHSRIDHVWALLQMAERQGVDEVYLHVISDGRDAPPTWMGKNGEAVEEKAAKYGAKVVSLCGRYFSLDRNNQWDRTEKCYRLLTERKGKPAATLAGAVKLAYQTGKTDEFIEPTAIANGRAIQDGDVVIFANFRTDRPRQLTEAFVSTSFSQFKRDHLAKIHFYTMTEYKEDLEVSGVLFPPIKVVTPLARVLSQHKLKQLHISETEKYAHVTFFLNGGREEPFLGETRVLIPSPDVATYDLKPVMSSKELTERTIKEIESDKYDVVLMNYPNADMVGHSGDLEATIKAVEAVDTCLGQLAEAILAKDGILMITADHGNAEVMLTPNRQIDTQHHSNKVPLMVIGDDLPGELKNGCLANVTPTLLQLLGIEPPAVMTAESLWEK